MSRTITWANNIPYLFDYMYMICLVLTYRTEKQKNSDKLKPWHHPLALRRGYTMYDSYDLYEQLIHSSTQPHRSKYPLKGWK